ncbi:hypothetical protein ACFOWZ_33515 [Lentzea rhizosphaerae]|uniref:Uncharacterized protein n=1 Tax=Lentzea rhizosphaerae TaxID=2041025 RepID=A0ABV8C367_9PSEU
MKPIPKVTPEAIADAVVRSVSSHRAEIAVPRYVGTLATVAALTPEPVLNAVRRLVRDDRALRPDNEDRAAYRAPLTGRESA